MKRAICHESGHAVVALYLGFHVVKFEVSEGFPKVICDLDCLQKTQEERCIVLAGGIASETLCYGNFDRQASGRDQNMITQNRGGTIDSYLPQALSILRSNKSCLRRFRERLTIAWVKAAAESAFDSVTHSFELLSQVEIEDIWKTCQTR
jgi:hypothetical protein